MLQYFIGTMFFFIVWLVLFLHKKFLRKEMLIMSLIVAPMGPLSAIFYLRDYWHPEYLFSIFGVGIEDLLFSFFIGGIGSVAYEEFFIKKMRKTKREQSKTLAFIGLICLFLLIILTFVFKINSIYSSSIVFLVAGAIVITKRHDLLKNAIGSGILVALIMLVFYIFFVGIYPAIIDDWWKLNNISGLLVFGTPIEELIWGFSWGFLSGPFYEFWRGFKEQE